MLRKKNILLISPEAWGQNMLSKHLYAKYLAKENSVYFLNPVQSSKNNPFGKIDSKVVELRQGLYSVDYKNIIPRLNVMPEGIQRKIYKNQARQIQDSLGIEKLDVVWSFDPFRFWNLKWFNAERYIYHSVDFHPNARFEEQISLSADHVIAVTNLIKEDLFRYRKDVFKVGHGADIEGFESGVEVEVPGKNKVKACYVGNFHRDIDYKVLLQLVTENDNVDFIMIGPTIESNLSRGNHIEEGMIRKLDQCENLYFIGTVPANELMGYLRNCDINLVLFKKEREKIHCSPHKMMAYFYSGNITVSNYIDEHKDTDNNIVIMKSTLAEIPDLFSDIVANISNYNSPDLKNLRRNFAIQNSYPNKIKEIERLLYSE